MRLKNNQILRNNKGVTLIEIMIVLTLIGGIVAAVVSNVMPKFEKGKVNQAKITIGRLVDAVDTFYMDCNYYPSESEGLEALVEAPSQCESWGPEPYLKNGRIPKDPWENNFIYRETDGQFEIISLGKDRKEGGKHYAKDISSREL